MERDKIYSYLKNKGFTLDTALDVGAGGGEWLRNFKSVYHDSRVLCVEPNRSAFKIQDHVDIEFALLWSEDNVTVPFYMNLNANEWCTGDSIYQENSSHYQLGTTCKVEYLTTTTINSVGKKYGIDQFDLIKLDVQGSEIDCLKGASYYLPTVKAIELECSFVEYNIGAPTIYDVFDYMKSINFHPYSVTELHHEFTNIDNRHAQIDFLFINNKFLGEI